MKGSITISKVDADTKAALAGVTFRLYNSTGTQVGEAKTDASGKVAFTNLRVGNYTYQEIATLDGYVLDSTVYNAAVTSSVLNYRAYVTGINCTEENAAKCFMRTKAAKDNSGGRLCYHAYQSFAKGEVNAETAHRIGVELAKEMWGDRFEVLVATHLNTEHYHSHFIINSVSFVDGKKFYNSPADLKRMREIHRRIAQLDGACGSEVTDG